MWANPISYKKHCSFGTVVNFDMRTGKKKINIFAIEVQTQHKKITLLCLLDTPATHF